ncbi:glycosyltransferase family 2 protein [Saccharibacillus alkalitolerans]|uniref:Glycosyltransferase family 2 protein n=1 Tax=Saccharibacillus alkalitolerans TaxID=2705290 RepID=A0ABX0F5R2_9BACL|nr:glycosyltransferase family 2 protein [Saccharibacillus alkalitolerans]NGZ76052.1 glycosyltransferase family 2 protein [Saccharibacillus alkalitolerans]
MGTIEVLLSSYNGEAYIEEQLNSLSSQTHVDWSVRFRDDGSSDGTMRIIEDWRRQAAGRITGGKGANVGVIPSFFELIRQADEGNDCFCFCDQDDVWLPEKMERAAQRLADIPADVPAMVFSPTQLVDAQLKPLGQWPDAPRRQPSFYNALYQNVAVGATVTFNRAALLLIRERMPDSGKVLMHDWWFYLCVSAFGEVIYDPRPSILYRQHGGNVVGGETSPIGKLKKKWAGFRKHRGTHKLVAQAREFHRLYAEQMTDSEKLAQLESFIAPRPRLTQRLNYLSRSKLYRQSRTENLLFRFLILIGYI